MDLLLTQINMKITIKTPIKKGKYLTKPPKRYKMKPGEKLI